MTSRSAHLHNPQPGVLHSRPGVPGEELAKEAESILQEMAHNFKMSNIRVLGFLFPKFYRNLYQHIYVNRAGIEKLRKTMKETPVVLLPSHRSYNDFLLMSYILYHYNLPLPRIAAGADFMAMKFVNQILRWAGAFYIRRSFGSDKLYWAVFTEYVQKLIVNGEAPVEFFLEGTRSRTGKSLPPKLGLLSVVLEPFLKCKVADVSLIPIGVSYERTLEEFLYAREMLGIPKPKESTSGLIKARSIFEDDYGSIYINFGDPISIRTLCEGHVERAAYSLSPRFLFSLTKPDQQFIFELAYTVLLEQQKSLVVSPWVLIASLLIQSPRGIHLDYLCKRVEWLKDIVINFGGNIKWPVSDSLLSVVKSSLAVHHTAASLMKDNRVYVNSASTWIAPGEAPPTVAMTKEEVMTIATTHILLSSYRNQLTPMMKQAAMIALTFSNLKSLSKDLVSDSLLSVVKSSLAVHHTAASLMKDNRVYVNSASTWIAPGEAPPTVAMTKEEVMTIATTHILLSSYRNQLTPMMKQAAMIALTFSNLKSLSKGVMFNRYRFLVSLMSKEFIFHPRTTTQDFEAILRKLDASYFVLISGETISVTTHGVTLVQFLQKMFHPFLLGSWFVCQYLLSLNQEDDITIGNALTREIQDVVASRIAEVSTFLQDFEAILRKLDASYFVLISGETISVTTHGVTLVQFLQKMFHPFLLGSWFVCQYLLSLNPEDDITIGNALTRKIQDVVASRIAEGDLVEYDILSLNLLDNAVKTCIQLGGLVNYKSGDKKSLKTNHAVLNKVASEIDEMIPVPYLLQEKPITNGKLVQPAAKL
ncbi:dihydroxyacetone phosphate acyltransferase-like [Anneissia japonica]|uniref:dihydroxyacetone phosphate acyltransferase-like n=1 Tax=Anneissia japonica TaxID=1529436 RepID=UPI0014257784|nr:dihydroxyacetone phosphate acyltransferase-like [Anneissia japonica]